MKHANFLARLLKDQFNSGEIGIEEYRERLLELDGDKRGSPSPSIKPVAADACNCAVSMEFSLSCLASLLPGKGRKKLKI